MATDTGKTLPIFMGHGTKDGVVRFEWGKLSMEKLKELGCNVDWNTYAGLDHSANTQEMDDMEKWLKERIGESA